MDQFSGSRSDAIFPAERLGRKTVEDNHKGLFLLPLAQPKSLPTASSISVYESPRSPKSLFPSEPRFWKINLPFLTQDHSTRQSDRERQQKIVYVRPSKSEYNCMTVHSKFQILSIFSFDTPWNRRPFALHYGMRRSTQESLLDRAKGCFSIFE